MNSRMPEPAGLDQVGLGPRMKALKRSTSGFTLVELMMSLVVLAILVGIAIPTYQSLTAGQRVRAAVGELHSALVLARSEAVKRNRSLTLSRTPDSWASGWKIANPVAGQPDILKHAQVAGVSIEGSVEEVEFSASGRVTDEVTFEVSSAISSDENKTSCLTLGLDGRASSSSGEC